MVLTGRCTLPGALRPIHSAAAISYAANKQALLHQDPCSAFKLWCMTKLNLVALQASCYGGGCYRPIDFFLKRQLHWLCGWSAESGCQGAAWKISRHDTRFLLYLFNLKSVSQILTIQKASGWLTFQWNRWGQYFFQLGLNLATRQIQCVPPTGLQGRDVECKHGSQSEMLALFTPFLVALLNVLDLFLLTVLL